MKISTNSSIYSAVSTTLTASSTQNTNSSFNTLVNTQNQETTTTTARTPKIVEFLDARNGFSSLSPTDEKIFRDILSDNKLTKEEANSLSYEQVERIAILLRQSDLPDEEWKSMPIVERGVNLTVTTATSNRQFNEAFYNTLKELDSADAAILNHEVTNNLGQLHLEKSLDSHDYAITDYATFVPYIYGRLMLGDKTRTKKEIEILNDLYVYD